MCKRGWCTITGITTPDSIAAAAEAAREVDLTTFGRRAELRASRDAVKRKYGRELPSSNDGQPLTLPEQATFELIPEQEP